MMASTCAGQIQQGLPVAVCRNPALAAKLEQERLLKAGISNHKTGLPPKLLELFEARPALEKLTPVKKRAPKVQSCQRRCKWLAALSCMLPGCVSAAV